MSERTNETQRDQSTTDFGTSCMEMMGKMMGGFEEGFNCESIISQVWNSDEIPAEWEERMSQMSSCCGSQEDSSTDTQEV
jgi:hypothetical protein